MSWDPAWLPQMAHPYARRRFLVRVIQPVVGQAPGIEGATWRARRLTSFSSLGTSMTPGNWASTVGGYQLTLAVPDVRDVFEKMPHGALVQILGGTSRMPEESWETIGFGQVAAMKARGPRLDITILDALSSLQSRFAINNPDRLPLFTDVGASTTLSATYTPGDAVIAVADTSVFIRESGVGKRGLARVEPTGGTPFYIMYDAVGGGALTLSNTAGGSPSHLGTSASAAPTNSDIFHFPLIEDHPLHIVAKMLVSTGTAGLNGTFDTLDRLWSYGLPLDCVDLIDIAQNQTPIAPVTGTVDWQVWTEGPQRGLDFLRTALAGAGLILTMRQGKITCRGVWPPWLRPFTVGHLITDRHITPPFGSMGGRQAPGLLEHDLADPDRPFVSSRTTYTSPYINREANPGAVLVLPAQETSRHLPFVHEDNAALQIDEASQRLSPMDQRVPERVRLKLAGLNAAGLAIGDDPDVTSRSIVGREEGPGQSWETQPTLLVNHRVNWDSGTTEHELLRFVGAV